MELLDKIREFVALQTALVLELKAMLGERDWELLLDVPKTGAVTLDGEQWSYRRHGVGVCFERGGIVVDANRHLDRDVGIFDAGRLLEFLESQSKVVGLGGEPSALDFATMSGLLRQLESDGELRRVTGLSGELFQLNG